jgi:hypothetical protein
MGGEFKEILRNFYNGFFSYNGFITDFLGFYRFWPICFDPEFKGVIENLEADRRG